VAVKRKIKKASDLEQLGINVRRIRNEREMTMAQLAFEMETSTKQISRIELGQMNGGILVYVRIARILGMTHEELFYRVKF
jgi:transcriptional regulator with XRE-family HTH domain